MELADQEHLRNIEIRLRSLSNDIIEHEACHGCRINATQALEALGSLEESLSRLGLEDPRIVHERESVRRQQESRSDGPPTLEMSSHVKVLLASASSDLIAEVQRSINESVREAVARTSGATLQAMMGSAIVAGPPAPA